MGCAVHTRLTSGHAFAVDHHRLDILQEVIRAARAGGGRDHHPSRAAIDGDYRPCCKRGILQDKQERQKKNYSSHVTSLILRGVGSCWQNLIVRLYTRRPPEICGGPVMSA